jgi:hypothetical protein
VGAIGGAVPTSQHLELHPKLVEHTPVVRTAAHHSYCGRICPATIAFLFAVPHGHSMSAVAIRFSNALRSRAVSSIQSLWKSPLLYKNYLPPTTTTGRICLATTCFLFAVPHGHSMSAVAICFLCPSGALCMSSGLRKFDKSDESAKRFTAPCGHHVHLAVVISSPPSAHSLALRIVWVPACSVVCAPALSPITTTNSTRRE